MAYFSELHTDMNLTLNSQTSQNQSPTSYRTPPYVIGSIPNIMSADNEDTMTQKQEPFDIEYHDP